MPFDLGIIDQVWLRLILVAAGAVFVGDLIANMISFSNRLMNAIVLAVIAGAFVLGFGHLVDQRPLGELLQPAGMVAALGFVVGYLGNLLAFGNRFVNALVTALVFLVLAGVGAYLLQTAA